ncbi:MAG: hypothetical protein KGH53_03980 [Candidatus Micrarchaeota archaeon]|nr:hypothetical protein [Candidatus Micrarchaeota archaeon]
MANKMLKRYGLEEIAKALIALGLLFNLVAWLFAASYYFGVNGGDIKLFIVPFIFTCVSAIGILVIKYRYTLFERYPYLMSLPSLFYRIGEERGTDNQSIAFSMIFTVHALIIAFLGFLSIILTYTVVNSIKNNAASPFFYVYLAVIAILIISVFAQYRRIYHRFTK